MRRESHVRFCEHAGVRFPRATRLVITGGSRERLEGRVKPLVAQFLATRGLALSVSKTVITHVDGGFDFLGWNVRRFRGMLVIQPSKKNRTAFLRKVRGVLDAHRAASQATVIDALVPLVRGWANYHRTQMASRTFSRCDREIWRALWRWACRRHPTQGDAVAQTALFPVPEGSRLALQREGQAAADLG